MEPILWHRSADNFYITACSTCFYQTGSQNMNKKIIVIVLILLLATSSFALWVSNSISGSSTGDNSQKILEKGTDKVILFKSMQCGCCGVYADYLKSKIGDRLTINQVSDTNAIKDKYNIPQDMRSCHTSIIGNYIVEGHVPIEAIDKLLAEKPDIKGIALPGMPSGAPGMPGSKTGDFVIYALNKDDSTSEFMRI